MATGLHPGIAHPGDGWDRNRVVAERTLIGEPPKHGVYLASGRAHGSGRYEPVDLERLDRHPLNQHVADSVEQLLIRPPVIGEEPLGLCRRLIETVPLGVPDASQSDLLEQEQVVLGHHQQRQGLAQLPDALQSVDPSADAHPLVLGGGEPLADVGTEALDPLLDLDADVVDRVPVNVAGRAVEAEPLRSTGEGAVDPDDVADAVGVEQGSEDLDVRLDPLDRGLHVLDRGGEGQGGQRHLG